MIGTLSLRDINFALPQALPLLLKHGRPVTAASVANARPTIEWPGIFITEYTHPTRNVLFDARRDANPFFHYLEAMWIIAGRNDVRTLAHILPKMAEYSDDGRVFHGAYGYRLRNWPLDAGGALDQVEEAVDILRDKPDSRQVVMSIWDPASDLGAVTKDMPCNDMIMCKVRDGKLNITVQNRSNDTVWGCYGANVVQFSMLQMYMAAKIGVGVGTYVQSSDSFHVYEDNPYWQAFKADYEADPLSYLARQFSSPYDKLGDANLFQEGIGDFDTDLMVFWEQVEHRISGHTNAPIRLTQFYSWAVQDAVCLWNALHEFRAREWDNALGWLDQMHASDWQLACQMWVNRRRAKANV